MKSAIDCPTSPNKRHQRIDGGRGEACGDDLALGAPQLAFRGQQPAPDRRRQDALHQPRLLVIRGIVEQYALHPFGLQHDVDRVAEDVALEVPIVEREFRPAVDGRPRPLAEESAPRRHRFRPARRVWRDPELGHRAAKRSAAARMRSSLSGAMRLDRSWTNFTSCSSAFSGVPESNGGCGSYSSPNCTARAKFSP